MVRTISLPIGTRYDLRWMLSSLGGIYAIHSANSCLSLQMRRLFSHLQPYQCSQQSFVENTNPWSLRHLDFHYLRMILSFRGSLHRNHWQSPFYVCWFVDLCHQGLVKFSVSRAFGAAWYRTEWIWVANDEGNTALWVSLFFFQRFPSHTFWNWSRMLISLVRYAAYFRGKIILSL